MSVTGAKWAGGRGSYSGPMGPPVPEKSASVERGLDSPGTRDFNQVVG